MCREGGLNENYLARLEIIVNILRPVEHNSCYIYIFQYCILIIFQYAIFVISKNIQFIFKFVVSIFLMKKLLGFLLIFVYLE